MTTPRTNHFLWLGPLLAVVGLIGYFTLIVRWRALSDLPWLNLAVLALALALSLAGLTRAWARGGALRRIAGVGGVVVSGLCSFLLVYYVFVMSYGLPDPASSLPEGEPVPAVTLSDDQGQPVELASLARGDLVLVFFRGHW